MDNCKYGKLYPVGVRYNRQKLSLQEVEVHFTLVKAFSFVIDDLMLAFIYEVHRLSRYFQLTVVFNAVIPAPAEVLHAFI